uniref:Uncharacterized protein n=1 Tax=Arundo donax TaxID=35708 RepID=A0A0A8YGN8_ARUDO
MISCPISYIPDSMRLTVVSVSSSI